MILKNKILIILGLVVLAAFAGSLCASATAEENQGTWHKVGKDVKETVKDVGKATKQTYEKTKEKSSETWKKTKEKGKKAYETGKKESKGFWHSVKETVSGWYESAKASLHSAKASKDEKKGPEKPSGSPSSSQ